MIEQAILSGLMYKEDFARKVLPFLSPTYFSQQHEKILYEEIDKFVKQYSALPTKDVLKINLSQRKGIHENAFKQAVELIDQLQDPGSVDLEWLATKQRSSARIRLYTMLSWSRFKFLMARGSLTKAQSPKSFLVIFFVPVFFVVVVGKLGKKKSLVDV